MLIARFSHQIYHRIVPLNKHGGKILLRSFSSSKKKSNSLSELKRLLSLGSSEKFRMAGAIGLLFISSGVTMSIPFALGKVVDVIYAKDAENANKFDLDTICATLLGVFVLGAGANFGRVFLMRVSAQNIAAKLRRTFYGATLRHQRLDFFDRNKTGELINRLASDSQLVSQTLTQHVSDGLRSGVMTAAGVGMMCAMSPQLAGVGLAVVPPVAVWAVFTGRKVKAASRDVQDALAEATQLAEERISNVRTVLAFAKQPKEIRAYDSVLDRVLQKSRLEAGIHARFYGMTGLSGNLIILSVLYYGGSLVTSDSISVGSLASFILYAAYVGIGLNGVSSAYAEIMKGLGASARLFEVIDASPKKELVQRTSVDLTGDIVIKDVDFCYPSRPDVKVLSGLNLRVPEKTVLAIVGSSGSGKSTIASLLLRLYEPNSGTISIGGKSVSAINEFQLRDKIGLVSQEPILFSTSIKENLLYGLKDGQSVEDEDLVGAAKEANAHDFISGFPDGYDTLVGERGVLLSGGQKQRIAIARAILRDPDILLLDEATSALDAASEHQVKSALQNVIRGRTVITIAHRLSTIKTAHRIVVLDKGRIVEEGAFDELAAKSDGHFKRLVQKQTDL